VGFGEKRKPAEQVAQALLGRARFHLESRLPVEEHLADQLLLPMAIAGAGSFYTSQLSEHTHTNIETIAHFLDVPIRTTAHGKGWKVAVNS
ncbi:MAG TPA: RNA 3'-terminal phosphate cyclase, partial [Candidatus Obscuribacterales bacterium]